jgi:eukaryotic-like serine/threonine-protein kinase
MLRDVDAEALYRFKREFRDLADISHPNLVTLYELLSDADQWFFTMELVNGVDFLEYVWGEKNTGQVTSRAGLPTVSTLEIESAPDDDETTKLETTRTDSQTVTALSVVQLDRLRDGLRQLAQGLCALHDAGKLHRDIKPSNVLVTRQGRVLLVDFGFVTELNADWLRQDADQQIVGTPAYMSPEQAAGLPISEASDWYSLGVILYTALTGRLPFAGSFQQILRDKQKSEPPAPSSLVPAIPKDLNALSNGLLRRDPDLRPSGLEVLRSLGVAYALPSNALRAPSSSARDTPFVGRKRHLAALTEAFEATKEGQPVVIWLHGDSGLGKSALAHRFLADLRQREKVVVLQGRCYEQESVPYKGLDGIVDALSQYLKNLSPSVCEALLPADILALARVFPVLHSLEVTAKARRSTLDICDSQELRKRAFATLRKLLSLLASREPLVLFIDDLQWGDSDSAALLLELLQPPHAPPLLLICSYRSQGAEGSAFLKTLLSAPAEPGPPFRTYELVVDKLDSSEALDLAWRLLRQRGPVKIARAEAIAKESGGNPFFIDQLVRYSHLNVATRETDRDRQTLPHATGQPPTGHLRLDNVIEAYLAQLSKEARRLLEVIAVAGQPVRMEIARRAANITTNEQTALTILRSTRMIRSGETTQRNEIETYHDRIREAVIAHLSPSTLKSCHHRLALALEVSSHADPEMLATHFRGAEEYGKASAYAATAAAQASEALAFDRAVRLYRLAIDLGPLTSPKARSLHVKLAQNLANAGRSAEAGEIYLLAADGASAAESVELHRQAAAQLLMSGHMDEGLSVLEGVLKKVGMKLTATPWQALLFLLFRRAQVKLRGLAFQERDAVEIPTEELIRIDTCWSVVQGLSMVDTLRAAEYQARHLLLALHSGEKHQIARALAAEAGYQAISGGRSRHRTQRALRNAKELAQRVDHPYASALLVLVTGMAAFLEGQWRESRRLLQDAEALLRDRCTGVVWQLATARLMSCVTLFFLGELRELGQCLPTLVKNAEERGDLYEATDLRIRISHAGLLAADDPENARREVRHAIARWPASKFYVQHWWSLMAEVEIALYSGESSNAWKLMTTRWSALRRSLLLRVQYILIESLFHRAQSALAVAATMSVNDRDTFRLLRAAERDARRIEREKMQWAYPLAQLIRAGIAISRGKIEEAVTRLASAEEGLEAAGMSLYAAAARRRRGELIGGDRGKALVSAAEAWMNSQQVKNPVRMTAMLSPGRWPGSAILS